MSDPNQTERNRLPSPAQGFRGIDNADPGGRFSFANIARLWRPRNTVNEQPACTVSRFAHRLVTATGEAKTAEELGGSVTAASIAAALPSATSAEERDIRRDLRASDLRGIDRLHNYRSALYNGGAYARPNLLFIGDSMIATAQAVLTAAVQSYGEISGWGLLGGATGGGASVVSDACVKWVSGNTWLLNGSGQYVEFAINATSAFEADSLRVYHVRQSGGGNFKIQVSTNGGAWTDEAGFTNIATDGALASIVSTIAKSAYATTYKIRCTWVSGSVNIIGAGYRDSRKLGPIVSFITNASAGINNIDNAALTARAITDPVFADIAPNLLVLSHLDGAALVNSSQATLQDNLSAGVVSAGAPAPSWLIVGPPIGYNDAADADRDAQQTAQMTLAASRADSFFDNRTWAMPVSTVVSRGLITDTTHYNDIAKVQWVPAMFRELGIFDSPLFGPSAGFSWNIIGGGIFEADSITANPWNGTTTVHRGAIRTRGTGNGIIFEDRTSPANANDYALAYFDADNFYLGMLKGDSSQGLVMFNNLGQFNCIPGSTGLNSRLGNTSNRFGRVYTGSLNTGIATRSANHTMAETEMTTRANAASGPITITLPTPAAANNGHIFAIVKIDSSGNAVTIGATVNGVANPTLTTQWQRMVVQSDGSTYTQIG